MHTYEKYSKQLGVSITPLVDLSYLSYNPKVRILAKDESKNLTGSVKIRSALYNLSLAIDKNPKKTNLRFLDASSGNYAIALAYISDFLNYKVTLFVPGGFQHKLKSANIFYKGISNSNDARKKALEYSKIHEELEYLDQYNNPGSWLCHYNYTAKEILTEISRLELIPTHFISSIGTGGTLVGIGRKLKEEKGVKVIGLKSTIPHVIKGLRTLEKENLPRVYSDNKHFVDQVIPINPKKIKLFQKENNNLKFGTSAFANLYTAKELSRSLDKGVIVTLIPDGGSL